MDGQRQGDRVVVETGLDEVVDRSVGSIQGSFRVHARTRRVRRQAKHEPARTPELGDPWCPLTVRARLQRMADVFRRIPHDPDTRPQRERSCMPTPVREIFKDQPGEAMRVPVLRADYAAACQVLDDLVKRQSRLQRVLIWGIAAKQSHRQLGEKLCCSHVHAGKRVQQMLTILVKAWNDAGWLPDAVDIERATQLIHRKVL